MSVNVAIGVQDFSTLIENHYFYVDKTAFLKEWWDSGDSVTLITRPRRFGKTLTMSMTEQFFSMEYVGHSCAHVMAQAVKHLYPQAKFWVGPVVKEGFYYDIDLGDDIINDEAIAAIEKEMKKVCKEGKKIYRREISKAEAMEMFKDDPYKLDLIEGLEDGNISVYDQGDFTDLCRGPHVDNTKLCKNFKLVKYSGVYWKGDANNHVMQRIYGVCFPTPEELEEHLKLLEEAKDRDHRKIGKEMNLFMSDDLVGRGLPMFLPKGYTVWQELENYIKAKERKLGYLHVMTPCVGTVNLYKHPVIGIITKTICSLQWKWRESPLFSVQ